MERVQTGSRMTLISVMGGGGGQWSLVTAQLFKQGSKLSCLTSEGKNKLGHLTLKMTWQEL